MEGLEREDKHFMAHTIETGAPVEGGKRGVRVKMRAWENGLCSSKGAYKEG